MWALHSYMYFRIGVSLFRDRPAMLLGKSPKFCQLWWCNFLPDWFNHAGFSSVWMSPTLLRGININGYSVNPEYCQNTYAITHICIHICAIASKRTKWNLLYIVLTYPQQSGMRSGGHRKLSMRFDFDASVHSSLFDIHTEALDKNRFRSVASLGHRNIKWDTSSASTEHKRHAVFPFWSPLKSIRHLYVFTALEIEVVFWDSWLHLYW